MASTAVTQGLLTFAFTDIVGSTRLWENAPHFARQALARHYEIVHSVVAANHGSVFKTVGDACCCVFDEPVDAVRASLVIQRALQDEAWAPEIGALRVRVGIHTGAAIAEGGDYFGPTLNRVARLTSAAHGGQVLLSAATAELVREVLADECTIVDLGSHRLKDLAEPQRMFQATCTGLPAEFPAPASLDAHPNNLPSQLSTFVGRRQEVDQLRDLLAENRLVTVCGLGGIGKTRLALQVAADTIVFYKDGSWLIRLDDVTDPDLVPQALAATLGISGVPAQDLSETLCAHLRSQNVLLLFDNAEHVLAQTALLVRKLLGCAAGMTILVTSREPLHVAGEHVLRIGRLVEEEAASLFIDRANLAAGDTYVRHICEKLDGLPLAIEIAAGRIGTLSPKQLDARLHTMLPVLVSKDTSQEARHRTLRATIEWSYRLLNPKEQRFFALLAIFEGGFTLEACEAVAWAGEEDDPAYMLLDALVDKSFVSAQPGEDSMRYRLLEVLRGFAGEKLNESHEAQLARSLHFDYFKSFADRWGTWQSAGEEHLYLRELAAEIPNMRAALDWGIERDDPVPAFELLLQVARYWQQHCNIAEARSWFSRACDAAGTHKGLCAKMLRRAATFATMEDDYDAARAMTQRALELFGDLGDRAGVAEAIHNLAVIEDRSGSQEEAHRLYARALELFEETGHEVGVITSLFNLALNCKLRGDYAGAKSYLDRGMSLCTSAEHADRLATFLKLRGEVAIAQGEFTQAQTALERSLEMKRDLENRLDEVEVLCSIAALNLRRGDLDDAEQYARQGIQLARDLDVPSLVIACFELFAVIFAQRGYADRGTQMLSLAVGMRRKHAYVFKIMDELRAQLEAMADVPAEEDASPEQVRRAIDAILTG